MRLKCCCLIQHFGHLDFLKNSTGVDGFGHSISKEDGKKRNKSVDWTSTNHVMWSTWKLIGTNKHCHPLITADSTTMGKPSCQVSNQITITRLLIAVLDGLVLSIRPNSEEFIVPKFLIPATHQAFAAYHKRYEASGVSVTVTQSQFTASFGQHWWYHCHGLAQCHFPLFSLMPSLLQKFTNILVVWKCIQTPGHQPLQWHHCHAFWPSMVTLYVVLEPR